MPLYFSNVDVTGKPYSGYGMYPDDPTPASIDLLGWNEADAKPRAYDDITMTLYESESDAMQVRYQENRQGIHAFHGKGQAIKYADDFLTATTAVPTMREVIVTRIELQGEVIEHEFGYRAEKTRVIEIHAGGSDEQRAELANLLGWPFEIHCCDMIPGGPTETTPRRYPRSRRTSPSSQKPCSTSSPRHGRSPKRSRGTWSEPGSATPSRRSRRRKSF